MASIDFREKKDGTYTYRVRIRVKGRPFFSLTFDSVEEACNWIDENEDAYLDDPASYDVYKLGIHRELMEKGIHKFGSIIKPKIYKCKKTK